ncbi:D-aminoacyl-tRNA deacylase [Populus alba x Populus x berolinensis]|nr:D-aminoacyl-tRNA deacylase [Populus alba x Populus x berolinensis]
MHCLHHSLSTLPSFAKSADKTAKKSTFASCKTLQIRAMRAVVQRVTSASVEVDGHMVSEIGPGLLVLVGLHESDTDSNADYICRKVLNMRLFTNESTGRGWDQNVMQRNYEVLLVSQFTLYGVLKGNKPDFHVAMPPQKAKPFYESLVDKFRKAYRPDAIKDGVFGAMMKGLSSITKICGAISGALMRKQEKPLIDRESFYLTSWMVIEASMPALLSCTISRQACPL